MKEMTNLKKIIDKAVSGGYDGEFALGMIGGICKARATDPSGDETAKILTDVLNFKYTEIFFDHLIFSHDFLKAFFGEEEQDIYCTICEMSDCSFPNWQYHAQQLVLSEDRISYLLDYMEENAKNNKT